jgi:hypothetical protein
MASKYIVENFKFWNSDIGTSDFVYENEEETQSSGVPEDLKTDEAFKLRLADAGDREEDYVYYKDSIYKVEKDGNKLKITKDFPKSGEAFKAYFSAFGGKLMEVSVTSGGIFMKEAPQSGQTASLSDESSEGEEIEIFLIKNTDGTDSDKIGVSSKSIKGKWLSPSKGGDEYSLLRSIIKNVGIPSKRQSVELKCNPDLLSSVSSRLFKAMDGVGTWEKTIIKALKSLLNSENPGNNMLALLYLWDGNKFKIKTSLRETGIVIGGLSGAVTDIINLTTAGGTLVNASDLIKFNRSTPIYTSASDTTISSSHRGLLMDIIEENEDSTDSEQSEIGGLLRELVNAMPEFNSAYRMVDSATGKLLYSTADTNYFDKKPSLKWQMNAKTFKAKYKQILAALLSDDEFEGID